MNLFWMKDGREGARGLREKTGKEKVKRGGKQSDKEIGRCLAWHQVETGGLEEEEEEESMSSRAGGRDG